MPISFIQSHISLINKIRESFKTVNELYLLQGLIECRNYGVIDEQLKILTSLSLHMSAVKTQQKCSPNDFEQIREVLPYNSTNTDRKNKLQHRNYNMLASLCEMLQKRKL